MRHGPAEDRAASGRDFDRALTHSGRERVRDVARVLVEADELPRVIFSSPLVRALQTAEIVAAAAAQAGKEHVDVEVRRELSPNGEAQVLVQEALAAGKRAMFVGHEPDLADLASSLAGQSFSAGIQKAMVVGLGTHKDDPRRQPLRLRFVLDPKSLAWLDDHR
jgi:phosphohistidine phosphatase